MSIFFLVFQEGEKQMIIRKRYYGITVVFFVNEFRKIKKYPFRRLVQYISIGTTVKMAVRMKKELDNTPIISFWYLNKYQFRQFVNQYYKIIAWRRILE